MAVNNRRILIIYGTQTGQSKAIAEDIQRKAESKGYDVELCSMEDSITTMPWTSKDILIVITSSTGDGEPPDNAVKFWKMFCDNTLPSDYLNHLFYCLLGLGDTNYSTFGGFPKAVDKRLEKLGAKKFYPTGIADDAVGLENVVDPWIENLWNVIENSLLIPLAIPEPKISQSEKETANVEIRSISQDVPDDVTPNPKPNENEETEMAVENNYLVASIPPLSESSLKVPGLPQQFLKLNFEYSEETDLSNINYQNGHQLPSSRSPIMHVPVSSVKQLTGDAALKTTLEFTLDISEFPVEYEPGDTIGILSPNNVDEVQYLLDHLNLSDKADVKCVLQVAENMKEVNVTSKPKYEVPLHLPHQATLRYLLTSCCEIRSVPRKGLLRALTEYTANESEKRRLLELSSIQGSEDYTKFVREPNINVLDIFHHFPSCHPPIELLLEHWPRLLPRPYSISSSPLKDPYKLTLTFNVVEFPCKNGRSYYRKGVATGWLQNMSSTMNLQIAERLASMQLTNQNIITIPIYFRTNANFRLPSNTDLPLILVGPGTGIAPFVGFLQHREQQIKLHPDRIFGPVWVFYGCRTRLNDFLYREELERLHSIGVVTRLLVSFSREAKSDYRYVQDQITRYGSSLMKLMDKEGIIYICGDATNMSKDVMNAFVKVIEQNSGLTEDEAKKRLLDWQKNKRYLQDIWT